MSINKESLSLKIIAIAISVLVLGILFYLFYFKPRQDEKKLKIQKENLEELRQEAFSELYPEEKPIEELTGEEREYKEAELAYQGCFDKTEELNQSIEKDGYTDMTNRYVVEWEGDSTGGWEYRFIEWLVEEHPGVCEEYDLNKIRHFLNKQKENSESSTAQEESHENGITEEETEAIIEQRINTAIAENEDNKEQKEKIAECKQKIKSIENGKKSARKSIKEYEGKLDKCNDNDCKNVMEDKLKMYKKDLKSAEKHLKEVEEECKDYL